MDPDSRILQPVDEGLLMLRESAMVNRSWKDTLGHFSTQPVNGRRGG